MVQRDHKDKDSSAIVSIVCLYPSGKGFFNILKIKISNTIKLEVTLWNLNQCY